jgi:hypothetical protein
LKRYCGRDFSENELYLMRALIAEDASRTRAELSRRVCQAIHWLKPDGGLKDMSCRVAMLRMQQDGLIQLPPPRCLRPQTRIQISVETDPRAFFICRYMTCPVCNYDCSTRALTPAYGMNSFTAITIWAINRFPVLSYVIGFMPVIS